MALFKFFKLKDNLHNSMETSVISRKEVEAANKEVTNALQSMSEKVLMRNTIHIPFLLTRKQISHIWSTINVVSSHAGHHLMHLHFTFFLMNDHCTAKLKCRQLCFPTYCQIFDSPIILCIRYLQNYITSHLTFNQTLQNYRIPQGGQVSYGPPNN